MILDYQRRQPLNKHPKSFIVWSISGACYNADPANFKDYFRMSRVRCKTDILVRNIHSSNAPRWVISDVSPASLKSFAPFDIRVFPTGSPHWCLSNTSFHLSGRVLSVLTFLWFLFSFGCFFFKLLRLFSNKTMKFFHGCILTPLDFVYWFPVRIFDFAVSSWIIVIQYNYVMPLA